MKNRNKSNVNYKLSGSGWADFTIFDGVQTHQFAVTYMHDSLLELSEATIRLLLGSKNRSVSFLDEPGELKMELEKTSDLVITVKGKWYKDYYSWNLVSSEDYKELFYFETDLIQFSKSVLWNMDEIWNEYGSSGYKAKWQNTPFPHSNYLKLKELLHGNNDTK